MRGVAILASHFVAATALSSADAFLSKMESNFLRCGLNRPSEQAFAWTIAHAHQALSVWYVAVGICAAIRARDLSGVTLERTA